MTIERRVARQASMLWADNSFDKVRAIMHVDPMRWRVVEVQKEPSGGRTGHGRKFAVVGSGDLERRSKQGDVGEQG